jgi:hypothetical protein
MVTDVFLALALIALLGSLLRVLLPDLDVSDLRVKLHRLVLAVFLPVLNFHVLYHADLGHEPWQVPASALAGVVVCLAVAAAIYALLPLPAPTRGALVLASAFGNADVALKSVVRCGVKLRTRQSTASPSSTRAVRSSQRPAPARRIAEHFAAIVAAVTSDLSLGGRRLDRPMSATSRAKALPRRIVASIALDDDMDIVWECPSCGDNGVISNWHGTMWDCLDADLDEAH